MSLLHGEVRPTCSANGQKVAIIGTLTLYYLYEKSPKKCRELEEIASSLKECLERSEWFSGRGLRPVRTSGTRFVSHKVAALNRFTNRFGAYLCHMISLTEDPAIKAVDKQKLKGYIKNGVTAKCLWDVHFFTTF